MATVALANLKGGVGKTTCAMFFAFGLAQRGRTMLVDADPRGSAMSWSTKVELPFPVVSAPATDLRRRLSMMDDYEHVVIDTPPNDLGITRAALLAAERDEKQGRAVLPIPPSMVDMDRLRPSLEVIDETTPELPLYVLLTRVRNGTRSAAAARTALRDVFGLRLLGEIPLKEFYTLAFGSVPDSIREYEPALEELLRGDAA